MRLVIADTGPINYLLLIGHIDVLPVLFQRIILKQTNFRYRQETMDMLLREAGK